MPTLDSLITFLTAHNWSAVFLVLASIAAWFIVRLSKDDAGPAWFAVPPRWRPMLAIGCGAFAGAVYKAAADGMTWKQGLLLGVSAGIGAVLLQVFGVDFARGGKDVPMPKALSVRPPPPPASPGNGSVDVVIPTPPPPPSLHERRALFARKTRGWVFATMVLVLPGCGLLHSAIPVLNDVIAVVEDGEQILAIIEAAATLFFAQHPDMKDVQASFVKIDSRAHAALDAATRLARAGEEADKGQLDAAMADFTLAYKDLMTLAGQMGIRAPGGGLMAGSGPAVPVPEPLAASWKASAR